MRKNLRIIALAVVTVFLAGCLSVLGIIGSMSQWSRPPITRVDALVEPSTPAVETSHGQHQ